MTEDLGTDIALNEDGDISFNSLGEISTISDKENLAQAIKLRLLCSIGSYFMQQYGSELHKVLGGKNNEIRAKGLIAESLRQEARIKTIESIKTEQVGDKLNIVISIISINNDTITITL